MPQERQLQGRKFLGCRPRSNRRSVGNPPDRWTYCLKRGAAWQRVNVTQYKRGLCAAVYECGLIIYGDGNGILDIARYDTQLLSYYKAFHRCSEQHNNMARQDYDH